MERRTEIPILNEREAFIESVYAEKKGRDIYASNPFTCYININSPIPNLPFLTASLLDELDSNKYEALLWASRWDKSIISIAPENKSGCVFLRDDDSRGKTFVPVSTTKLIDAESVLKSMPDGTLGFIGINDQPMTTDAFLITYFHMVNELTWDIALQKQGKGRVDIFSYSSALEDVRERGFSVGRLSEAEIIQAKKQNPKISVRIYGSKVNRFVPKIMGAILEI